MKTFKVTLLFVWFIGISVWGLGGDASGAIFVTVTPSSGPADEPFTIQTTAAAPEGRVLLEFIYDFDNSGSQNGDEWPEDTESFLDNYITNNDNFTGDLDPAGSAMTINFDTGGEINPSGQYIVRVTNELGESAETLYAATPVYLAQTVSGIVYIQGTTTPVSNASVWCDGEASEVSTHTDANGSYTVQSMAGDVVCSAVKSGYLEPNGVALSVPAGGNTVQNLDLVAPTTEVTGIVSEYGTGNPVWGSSMNVEIPGFRESIDHTDMGGAFAVPALAGEACEVDANWIPGYFGFGAPDYGYSPFPIITPTLTGPNIVNFTAHKETAWIEATLLDEYGQCAVEWPEVIANRTNTSDPALSSLFNNGETDSLGQVTVGLEAGDWSLGAITNDDGSPLVCGAPAEIVPQPRVEVSLSTGSRIQQSIYTYYADGAIEGRVTLDNCGTPGDYLMVRVYSFDAQNGLSQDPVGYVSNRVITDINGYYRLPVLSGTWTVKATSGLGEPSNTQIVTVVTDGNDKIDQSMETVPGVDLTFNRPCPVNFHPYDKDQDWTIGDFELLDAIDDWAAGNLGDFELLDLIDYWAEGCYYWDISEEKHKPGCQAEELT